MARCIATCGSSTKAKRARSPSLRRFTSKRDRASPQGAISDGICRSATTSSRTATRVSGRASSSHLPSAGSPRIWPPGVGPFSCMRCAQGRAGGWGTSATYGPGALVGQRPSRGHAPRQSAACSDADIAAAAVAVLSEQPALPQSAVFASRRGAGRVKSDRRSRRRSPQDTRCTETRGSTGTPSSRSRCFSLSGTFSRAFGVRRHSTPMQPRRPRFSRCTRPSRCSRRLMGAIDENGHAR